MGSLYKNGRVRSYIMILLVFTALLISSPVKKVITEGVNNRIKAYTSLLYEKTGLTATYEKLSPSILSSFYVRGIKLYDGENQLLSIDKTKISYSILNVIRGDFQKGVSSIVVDGINIDVDELINLSDSISAINGGNFNFAEVKKMIPGSIKLKNINLEYTEKNIKALLAIKNFSVSNPIKRNTVDVQAGINLDASINTPARHVSGKVDISGSITEDFNGSQLNLKLRNLTDGTYKLSKLNLHASYDQGRLDVHTIQAVNPISLGIFYNFDTGDVNAQLRMDGLSPVSILTINSRQLEVAKFRNLKIYTDTIIKSNVKEKTLNYLTDTRFNIPDEAFSGGLDVGLSLYGDEKKLELTNLSVNGPRCSAAAKLSFVYDTKQLSGFIEVPEFQLSNGNIISTELYFDPMKKGFMAFSPQIFIGSRALTALQLSVTPQPDSYDLSFEFYDYSHIEESDAGMFKFEGSYLNASKYLQSNITLSSLYLDSMALIAAQLLPEKEAGQIESLQKNLEPYLLSGDVYAATDFKTFSYNIPYVLLANSRKDNQALMFALNGNDTSIQLNQLSLILGKYALEASASVEQAPDSSDYFFVADINADSIPYHFTGSIMPETCIVSGDYGTDVEIRFGKNKSMSGHAILKSLPIKFLDNSFVFSTTTNFNYDTENGPSIRLENLEVEDAGSSISVNPKVVLSGNATRYGAAIDSISYTDLYSTLEGNADLLLNINENIFDSIGVMLNLKNPITEEGITLDGSISNPDHLPINKETLLKNIYINLQMQLKNFGLNRFVVQKNDNNMISGMLFASGTLEHPYVSLNVDTVSVLIAANMLYGSGNILVEDRDLSINDLNIKFSNFEIKNIQAAASLTDMTLDATGEFAFDMLGNTLYAPLTLTVGNAIVPEGKFIPDTISATLSTPAFSGNILKKPFPLSLSAIYANKAFSFYSSDNAGFYGSYTTDGLLELNLDNKSFLAAKIDGFVDFSSVNLEVYDVSVNLPEMCKYLNVDEYLIVDSGIFGGNVVVTGTMNDPEINGIAQITSPVARVPILTKQKLTAPDILFTVESNEIQMQQTVLTAKNNQRILAELKVFLNKWSFEHMEGTFKTYKTDQFPVNFKTDFCSLDGNISADIGVYFEDNIAEITGKISGENVDLGVQLLSISNMTLSDNSMNNSVQVVTDLDITLGTHASVRLDPILRCVFVPNTTIKVIVNQPDDLYVIDGEVKLKAGDLAYLNRSFYIKSGTIKFNKEDITNPIITVNAETREKDDSGQTVKIVLDVEDQYLMDLQPRFSSIPPKSENEIQQLLGQIVMADADNATSLLFSASDYAIQSTVVRQAENKLRDLLNFDIFSLRTNVLQNTYNYSVARNMEKEKGNQKISIGNFLDNTTVYIGKYLGSSLYVDAMLHLSFEDSKVNDISDAGKVLFQPEFGMELESPFANIRVNMAPDINALLKNQFVPSTSVTLSWKFTF